MNILTSKDDGEVLIAVASILCVQHNGTYTSICIDNAKTWATTSAPFELVCQLIKDAGGQIAELSQ
jgi:hypothetical protein